MIFTNKEWLIINFLYFNANKYKKTPLSLKNIEVLMGYNKTQSGGIRKFLNFLVKQGVLIKTDELFNLTVPKYLINTKNIDKLIEKQPIYHVILNLEYGETKFRDDIIPLPADI